MIMNVKCLLQTSYRTKVKPCPHKRRRRSPIRFSASAHRKWAELQSGCSDALVPRQAPTDSAMDSPVSSGSGRHSPRGPGVPFFDAPHFSEAAGPRTVPRGPGTLAERPQTTGRKPRGMVTPDPGALRAPGCFFPENMVFPGV